MAEEESLMRLIPALWRGAAPARESNFHGAVLVADLAGFTALTEALEARGPEGNEAIGAILNRLFARLTGAIAAADGDVIHFSGDALSAVFPDRAELSGLTRAMGAARALRLALAQQAQTRALGRRIPLRVRLGIGAGAIRADWLAGKSAMPVIAGPAVAAAWKNCALDRTALAHPPAPDASRRAAGRLTRAQVRAPARALLRLLDPAERANGAFRPVAVAFLRWPAAADRALAVKARAGELLTHGFSSDAEDEREIGACSLKLKGFAAPVAAQRESSAQEGGSSRAQRAEIFAAPIFGRTAELSRLDGFLAGSHRLLVVSGEAGAGKSRLLGHWLAARRISAARGACSAAAQAIPYTPWRGVVRDRLQLRAPAGARLERALRAALHSLGAAGALLRADLFGFMPGPARKRGRRELLARGMAQLCGGTGGLIVIEDGHWLDGASALLLRELLALPDGPRIILSLRPGAAPAALAGLADDALRLSLAAMDAGALQARAAAEWRGAPGWLGGWLHRRSGGNALYAGELIAALLRGPWREDIPVRARPEDLDAAALPRSLRGLVQDRLDRLPAAARAVVLGAAVIGRIVPLRLLARTLETPQAQLQKPLAAAVAAGLLAVERGGGDPVWIFPHALQQEALYAGLAFAARRRLHGRVADHLLTRRGSERAGAIGRAVHHLRLAGDKIRLSEAAREAAIRSARRQAFAEAWDYFALALQALPRDAAPESRLSLRMSRGRCALELGRLESARRDFTYAAAGVLRALPS